MNKPKIYVVEGPTASGKSSYAIELAIKLGGEIISGDSMQIYRGMDIGTAKATSEEMRGIRHHLIDVCDLTEPFSCARFVELAEAAIQDILSRGKAPIIAGGTGLYIDTLVSGISLGEVSDSPEIRDRLYREAEEYGALEMHRRLAEVDPESADSIHPNNVKRVVRALEIYLSSGITKTELDRRSREQEPKYDAYSILLCPTDREILNTRIERRVDAMLAMGLEAEVGALVERGLRDTPTASQAIGYKEFYPYFDGEADIKTVRDGIVLNTKHYAKRQMTWFGRNTYDEVVNVNG